MKKVRVLHLIDTLQTGGAEAVAVTLVNHLPRERFRPYLCATRAGGPLEATIAPDVPLLLLHRRYTLDPAAIRLASFVAQHRIDIVHAHGTSLFLARLVALGPGGPVVLWHSHYGRFAIEDQTRLPYLLATRRIGGVIAVNRALARWVVTRLRVPLDRVWYAPNPVSLEHGAELRGEVPGKPGKRIVCVANFHPDKDHDSLIRAFSIVASIDPDAALLLVGAPRAEGLEAAIRRKVDDASLTDRVSFLGQRDDVHGLLRASDIGVLSSRSEGLSVALLEYGAAGLPVVATSVGQNADVLDLGHAGILVPPGSPEALAAALLRLLRSPEERTRYGAALRQHVEEHFGASRVADRFAAIYEYVLDRSDSAHPPEPVEVA
ncbi:MAG: glycosyltransferase [Bryobacteraceae bacterium]